MPARGTDGLAHLIGGENAQIAVQGAGLRHGHGRRPAAFRVYGMGGVVQDNLVPGFAMDPEGNLIAHGARGHEHGRLLAQQLRHHGAKLVDGRVFELLFVAYFRLRHGLAHGGRGFGVGVAVQINARCGHVVYSDCLFVRR